MKNRVRARPVLKWAGGKQALADRLLRSFPEDFTRYYEPFVGGASVLLALRPGKAVIGDRSPAAGRSISTPRGGISTSY
jgi:DNA adenine methylase